MKYSLVVVQMPLVQVGILVVQEEVKKWSACVKPNNKGLETGTPAYHTGDGGYRYMYRHWSGSDNRGYNRINDTTSYKDNTHSSNANNGVNYTVPSTDIKLVDYENVNVIRQACNRGPKMVLPTLSTEWVSTIPASTGGTSGWKRKYLELFRWNRRLVRSG